jgi:hypothetical protein
MYLRDTTESLARIGPGTPMGEVLRRFWVPALLVGDVADNGGPPVKLRLFGEDLLAFRDVHGRVGIAPAYPTILRGGVVWIYMGPQDFLPQLPDFEWATLPETRRFASKRIEECNWARAVERGMVAALPVSDVKEVDYGLLLGAHKTRDEHSDEWHVTQFLVPFYTLRPPGEAQPDSRHPYYGTACVPIDDDLTYVWSFGASPARDFAAGEAADAVLGDAFSGSDPAGASGVPEFHHTMIKLARENARGHVPEAAQNGSWYAVRSASLIVERGVPFDTPGSN